jgi:lipopolysaccharide biosynthesis regulator YciM
MALIRRFVRAVTDGTAGPDLPYRCQSCGEAYAVQYYVCPACGGFSIDPLPEPGWDA